MYKNTIYLAGNIAHLSYEDATEWRVTATTIFEQNNLHVLDPMREKEHLKGSVVGFTHDSNGCTAQEIFNRDTRDVRVSDVIFAYITGYSIGTSFELGMSHTLNKKIVIVTTDELIKHPFLSESAHYITTDFFDGVNHVVRRYGNFSN